MACTICFERFKGSDNLYSTTCGHVYHLGCMQQWKSRSSSCPQCRVYNPKTHKIYLEFDDVDTNKETALQAELNECRTKIIKLELELKKHEVNVQTPNKIRELEETLDDTLAHNARIVEQLKSCETRIANLRNQCTVYDRKIISLNDAIQKLTLEKVHYAESYENLKAQHKSVQKCPAKSTNTPANNCLQSLIRQTTILITGAEVHPTSKLPNFVLFLAHKMNLQYTRQDIVRASNYDDHLIVQFRYPRMKEEFCSNEYKLSFYSETDEIDFHDILGDVPYENLFEFALNLKLFGYKSVFRRADKIFTCRNGNDEPIRIYSKEHVEELINEVK